MLAGIVVAALSGVLTVALGEFVLRLYQAIGGSVRSAEIVQAQNNQDILRRRMPALAELHPDRVFELRPNVQQIFEGNEFTIGMSINSRRLRDIEHRLEKAHGVYRMLAVGNSFTFGWGVDIRETWWSRLVGLLKDDISPMDVEVVNLGVYMYTFDQQVQRLEDFGLAYKPNIIIADFYYPHVVTIATHTYQEQGSKPWPRILDSTLYVDEDGLLRFGQALPFERIRRFSLLADFLISRFKIIRYKTTKTAELDEYELLKESRERDFEEAWQRTRSAYARLITLARQEGIPVLLFMIPRDMQVWPRWKEHHAALSTKAPFTSRLPQRTFGAICEDLQIWCLDLLPQYGAAAARDPHTPLYYTVDVHWTAAGHALASQIIRDYLVQNGLVQRLALH